MLRPTKRFGSRTIEFCEFLSMTHSVQCVIYEQGDFDMPKTNDSVVISPVHGMIEGIFLYTTIMIDAYFSIARTWQLITGLIDEIDLNRRFSTVIAPNKKKVIRTSKNYPTFYEKMYFSCKTFLYVTFGIN